MIFSSPARYAIRAITYLGGQEVGRFSSIKEISRAVGVPLPYLAKIINRLSRKRLVIARPGPTGGVMLGKPASLITVGEIVEAIDGRLKSNQCIVGFPECNDSTPCPIHESWKSVRESLNQELHKRTVRDLVCSLRNVESNQATIGS